MVDFATLGSAPISADNPAGASARYEPEFEELEGEISKLESLSGGEVRWSTIVELASKIIGEKSKDMLVASYLAYALYRTQGLSGLADGLHVYLDMMKTHWDGMFPTASRANARKSAIKWLVDRMVTHMESDGANAGDKEPAEKCHAILDEMYKLADEKFEGQAPPMNLLIKAMKTAAEQAAGAGAAPAGDDGAAPGDGSAAAVGGGGGAAAPAGGAKAVASAVGPIASRQDALKRLKDIADFFRKNEPHNPAIMLIERAIKWASMPLEEVLTEILHRPNFQEARNVMWETLGVWDKQNQK